ncbi:MAG: radical SAM protein [Deltaproteobacteria bacterium]|nr:radical SAM protein [Deltaproteobacteria bacterium]
MKKDSDNRIQKKDRDLFDQAWNITRENHGSSFTFYLPGMIRYGKMRGLYPALSLTGDRCQLLCEHCKGLLLKPMIKAEDPETLITKCRKLAHSGHPGVLLSGGSDREGRLPWKKFYQAIQKIKTETDLFLSVHSGFLDFNTAVALKEAGVDQALIDVMGDEETAKKIYHLDSLQTVITSLENLFQSGLDVVPHVVAGLMHGKIQGEYNALHIIRRFNPSSFVIVVLTPLKGTPMEDVAPPSPIEVARLIASARVMMPYTPISLGCERPRNRQGQRMEELAIYAGATKMAVWSKKTIDLALNLGLIPRFQPTCCSVPYREELSSTFSISI